MTDIEILDGIVGKTFLIHNYIEQGRRLLTDVKVIGAFGQGHVSKDGLLSHEGIGTTYYKPLGCDGFYLVQRQSCQTTSN